MSKRGNGEGSITYERDRNRWVGRITVGTDDAGRPVRRKVTAPTRPECIRRLDEAKAAAAAGMTPLPRDATVGRFLTLWIDDVLPGTVAAKTEESYRFLVRQYLMPHLGRHRLSTMSARDVTAMLRALDAEGKSANTQRLARAVLRRALRYAQAEGWVSRNVAAIAQGPKLDRSVGRTLTVTEARALLDAAAAHRLGAAITVALSLGLRLGETLGLTWQDVDLDTTPPRLRVVRSLKTVGNRPVIDDVKTARSRRTLHLPPQVVDTLRRHRIRQLEERLYAGDLWEPLPLGHDLVFRTEAGTPVDSSNYRRVVYTLTEAAGVGRWSPHELRHSAASLLIAQSVPLKLVSEMLGHSTITITADVYGHLLDEAKDEVAAAMGRALWAASV